MAEPNGLWTARELRRGATVRTADGAKLGTVRGLLGRYVQVGRRVRWRWYLSECVASATPTEARLRVTRADLASCRAAGPDLHAEAERRLHGGTSTGA